ncbi:DNA methyltransferase [Cellulophaga phage phi10:1]|uniref:site-specific DNA-methyltransferase (adenine-specific) n=1 Tax=Cellulophaga phage phi10:1 TaxID=1327981 RepID=R9ZYF8_9CAUD|nr:DNA methyltransferase [Cellulophaga phage phi10:1]AGO48364.1 DNA methylase [Cellulophaga phage phi10:1]
MILRRLGNKKKIASEIQKHFPPHKIYIEPFFGAGGMFFNKPKAKYNIVNDLDSDVFNLFQVVMNQKEELEKAFYMMPIHSDLLDYWKKNEETEPIKKALRFLFLSNLTFMGTGEQLRINANRSKEFLYKNLDKTFELLYEVQFTNVCFEKFFRKYQIKKEEEDKTLIYCDPPYLGTNDNYSNSFTEEQSESLFNTLEETKCKFAMSEFDHPFILEQAEKRGLNVIIIGERQNLKNRRTEILVTNYENRQISLF